jgi:hypothetical protein
LSGLPGKNAGRRNARRMSGGIRSVANGARRRGNKRGSGRRSGRKSGKPGETGTGAAIGTGSVTEIVIDSANVVTIATGALRGIDQGTEIEVGTGIKTKIGIGAGETATTTD